MAKVLKIGDASLEVNLYNGTLVLAEAGWAYKTDRENVTDTIECVSGDADVNIRGAVENLATLFRRAREFAASPTRHAPVWLTWQAEGESAARRALVLGGEYEIVPGRLWTPMLGGYGAIVRIAIEHLPEWEDVTQTSRVDTNLDALGGKVTIAAPGGSEDARIDKLELTTDAMNSLMNRFWIGIRPFNKGITGFVSRWSCYLGDLGWDTVVDATPDQPAKAGSSVICTFTTAPELASRLNIQVKDVSGSNYDHMAGSYLVIGRLRVGTSNTQIRAQLRAGWGWSGSGQAVVGETYLDGAVLGTKYQLVPLGSIQIPPESNQSVYSTAAFDFKEYGMSIYLERLSAGGYIDLDSLILVPTEHHLYVDGADFSNAGGKVTLFTAINGQPFANGFNANGWSVRLESSFYNWRLPADGGVMVFAGTEIDLPSTTATVDLTYQFTRRWSSFRSG
jgi:hypothetical protein